MTVVMMNSGTVSEKNLFTLSIWVVVASLVTLLFVRLDEFFYPLSFTPLLYNYYAVGKGLMNSENAILL